MVAQIQISTVREGTEVLAYRRRRFQVALVYADAVALAHQVENPKPIRRQTVVTAGTRLSIFRRNLGRRAIRTNIDAGNSVVLVMSLDKV